MQKVLKAYNYHLVVQDNSHRAYSKGELLVHEYNIVWSLVRGLGSSFKDSVWDLSYYDTGYGHNEAEFCTWTGEGLEIENSWCVDSSKGWSIPFIAYEDPIVYST